MMGDTHGDVKAHMDVIEHAKRLNIKHIFQLGDCGVFPVGFSTYQDHLERLNNHLRDNDVIAWWVRGNHDDTAVFDQIPKLFPAPHHSGFLRSNIRLFPRVSRFGFGGLQFMQVGGAVSIDREWRVNAEKAPRTLYWPDEAISDADVNLARQKGVDGRVDVLLTHECSNRTPFRFRLKTDADSQDNRLRLDTIIDSVRPHFHFHGHMHEKYDWVNHANMEQDVRTFGLECNPNGMQFPGNDANWLIFDLETKTVTWGNES